MMRRTVIAIGLFLCAAPVLLIGQRDAGAPPDIKVVKRDYDHEALIRSAQTPLTEDQRKGRNLWLQRCAFCHDGLGTPTYNTFGPYLDAELVTKRGDNAVRDKILKGSSTMPAFQWALKPAQVQQLIVFMKTIAPDQKPTEAQKAGKTTHTGDL